MITCGWDNLRLGGERILKVVGAEEGGRRFVCREGVNGIVDGFEGMVALGEVVGDICLSGEWPECVVEEN